MFGIEPGRVLAFLRQEGFREWARRGACVTLRHPGRHLTVTISAPAHGRLGRVLITRLLVDLCFVQPDLKMIEMGEIEDHLGSLNVGNLAESLSRLEKQLVKAALERYGNVAKASAALGVSRPTLYEKMEKFGLSNPYTAEGSSGLLFQNSEGLSEAESPLR